MRVITKAYPDEIGTTDGIRTYCCSATPCYFVSYTDGYEGYFEVSDCKCIDGLDALQIHNLKRNLQGKLIGE